MFRGWRRRRVLERRSIPDAVWNAVIDGTRALAELPRAARGRLRDLAVLFLHEKRIEAAGSLELDEPMRVRIAALACLPILELDLDHYEGFASVIVYPDEFVVPNREVVDEDGVVHVGDDLLAGEAWEQGPVILSWQDIEASGRGDGFNVVAHEFAHKLDMLDGAADGLPPLHADMRVAEWSRAFTSAYDDLLARIERGEETWIDPYAAEDPAEFFAVCVELFFDAPRDLRAEYPALYAQLAAYFRQDPAARSGTQSTVDAHAE